MAELREALLDPERYASSAPAVGIPDDLSGIARAAAPMARAELDRRSHLNEMAVIGTTPPPPGTPSGRGELIENIDNLIRTKRGSRVVVLSAIASLTVAGFALFGRRNEPHRPIAAANAPLHPATVRVNFNSDPDGAVVTRADGKALGLTPLSIEIAYSDSAVEFQFKKAGFETKTMYIVPNLPSPLFATLRRIEAEPNQAEAANADRPAQAAPAAARARRQRPAAPAAPRPP